MYVAEQIEDFLDHAARLSFLEFEQYVTAWKYLMDQSRRSSPSSSTRTPLFTASINCWASV
jgi:hypothetical protein